MGNIREGLNGENMTATEILEQQTERRIIDEMVQRAAKELQEEIDFSMLADLYKSSGWTEIEFDSWYLVNSHNPVKQWLKDSCKGHYTCRDKRFLFEKESDAVNFLLRWAN